MSSPLAFHSAKSSMILRIHLLICEAPGCTRSPTSFLSPENLADTIPVTLITLVHAASLPLSTLDKRDDYPPGISIRPDGGCNAVQKRKLVDAFNKARSIVDVADGAASKSEFQDAYNFFFNTDDKDTVNTAFGNVGKILGKESKPVVWGCRDSGGYCNSMRFEAYYLKRDDPNLLYYEFVACPAFFTYPVMPDPCNQRHLDGGDFEGGVSRAYLVMHEMLHLPHVAGDNIAFAADIVSNSYGAHVLKTKNDWGNQIPSQIRDRNPTENADSYALFANWCWMQSHQKDQCGQNYPLWNTPKKIAETDKKTSSDGRTEFRRLLALPDNVEDGLDRARGDVITCDAACDKVYRDGLSQPVAQDDTPSTASCSGACDGDKDSGDCGEGCECARVNILTGALGGGILLGPSFVCQKI